MKFSKLVNDQLRSRTKKEFAKALERDGWELDIKSKGGPLVYIRDNPKRRVVIHYHPKESYRSMKLIGNLLSDIGWDEKDLKRLKLIK